MANVDNPTGFAFTSLNNPNPPDTKRYIKLVGVAQAIYQQDVVFQAASSTLSEGKGAITPIGTPGTTVIMGVAQNRGVASLKTRHHVIVDPRAEFIAQDDGDTDGVGATQANDNANVSLGTGSDVTGFSGHEIDEASIAVTATLDLQLIALAPDISAVGNAFGSSHVRMICKFHNARFGGATAGL
jgi:hypothetical protein